MLKIGWFGVGTSMSLEVALFDRLSACSSSFLVSFHTNNFAPFADFNLPTSIWRFHSVTPSPNWTRLWTNSPAGVVDLYCADLALVENQRAKVTLSKPIAVGCVILENANSWCTSSTTTAMLPKFGDRLHLCFFGHADSFICHVQSKLRAISDWLDTVELPQRSSSVFERELSNVGKIQVGNDRRNFADSARKSTRSRRSLAQKLSGKPRACRRRSLC